MEDMGNGTVRLTVPELLKEREWSITKFMRESGLSYPTAHRIARGNAKGITLNTIDTLCEIFGVSIDELIVREEAVTSGD